ncbi:M20/M25/M40 family metallo-hydrolase [Paractinoplanes atraurantiacus]|uniref:Glutamate carboxypeptidase n=1 Tax=Paractinoplanes atraurantiacus TaxID=1036182 RepID=A0A285IZ02_9ACTN|nr:M20/M25/M40 family metallo-hydrolase [Actinoplanes atraurantiacus]SNY53285.1 glutamate carboxypeptidase [Actinoplanes atraurantiacus]
MHPIEALRRYTLIESPTGDRKALDELAEVLSADAAQAGFRTDREDGHLLWSRPGGPGRPLLFLSHYDTVWPVGTLRDMPWSVEGDTIKGPGVYDTKSGLAALLAAASSSGETTREIRVLVVADEEIGSPTATGLVRSAAAEAHAVFGLEPPHPNGDLKTGRRGSTRARVTVTGIESHAALDPDAGVNAIDELIDQLLRVRALVDGRQVLLNTGTIEGGGRTNVVAGHAHADLGLRFLDPADEEAVLGGLAKLSPVRPRAEIATTLLAHRATWRPGTDDLLARVVAVADSIGQKLGGSPADGAADTNTTGAMGVPTVDGLAPRGGGAHARHEWVSAAGITERIALLEALFSL